MYLWSIFLFLENGAKYALSLVANQYGQTIVKHYLIYFDEQAGKYHINTTELFPTVSDLIFHYTSKYFDRK